jgi:hypothetical protein
MLKGGGVNCIVGATVGAGVSICNVGVMVGGDGSRLVQQRSRHPNFKSAKNRFVQVRTHPSPGSVSQNRTHPGGEGLPSDGHSMAQRSG